MRRSCDRRRAGAPADLETVVKRALAVAVAGAALYLVLPKLIAVLTVPDLIRGTAGRADAAVGPFLPGSGTFGSSGPKPDASPPQAAGALPSSKVITMRPQSW
jgi:hypothetical protein